MQNNKAVIYCNKKSISNFEPYFYVKHDAKVPKLTEIIRIEDTDKVSLYGDKLKKIITKSPYDVKSIREHFSWTGETDIRFTKRFNIDKNIRQKNNHKLYIDIEEVVPKGSNPDVIGKYPISMICVYSTINDVYHQWVFHPKLFVKSISVDWKSFTGHSSKRTFHQFNHEKLMLLDFMGYIMYHKPDVIIEWSKKPFDIANIVARMNVHDIHYRRLSPIHRVKTGDYVDVCGIETISMLHYYKKSHIGEVPSLALDNVCKDEYGQGKLGIIDDFKKAWNSDLSMLLDYNCTDVEMMVNLNKHTELFDNIQYIIDYIGCELNDYMSSMSIVRHFLLKKANEYNFVLDTWKYENIISFIGYNKEYFDLPGVTLLEHRKDFNRGLVRLSLKFKTKEDEKRYLKNMNKKYGIGFTLFSIEGAHVMNPQKGIHEDVDLFDFSQMYPNIIIERNMSPETLVSYKDRDKYKKEDLYSIGNGVYFLKQHVKVGFLPKVLLGLFAMRSNIRKQMVGLDKKSQKYKILDKQQIGIKYIINSFYGVMKFICIQIAESTTFVGRQLVKFIIKEAKEVYCEVLYGDTDSIYVKGADSNFPSTMMDRIKSHFGFNIELEHDGFFPKMLFITKKRYVMQNKDGSFKYKGIEIRKGGEPENVKNSQKKLISMLFDGKSQDIIMDYLRGEIVSIPDKPPSYVARRVRLNFNRKTKSGITKYEIAAKNANNTLYKHYENGDKPYYLPGICFDYDNEVEITNSMLPDLTNEFVTKMQLLFNALGWDADDLRSKYRKTRLEI